jgi:hypothetical protein
MVNVNNSMCTVEGCHIARSWGYPGGKPLFCSGCAKQSGIEGLADVKSKMCITCGNKHAHKADVPNGPRKYCADCAPDDAVSGDSRMCACGIRASFAWAISDRPQWCGDCKDPKMINVVKKTCANQECRLGPSYGIPGSKKAEYCESHASDDMINVIDKRCDHPLCGVLPKIASFAKPNTRTPTRCKEHKTPEMICVRGKFCDHPDCDPPRQARYGYPTDMKPLRCSNHTESDMEDVVNKRCAAGCGTFANCSRYNGHCLRCFLHLFPDQTITKQYRIKERHVVDYLATLPIDFSMICDKRIEGGCSARRPDVFWDCGTHVVIVEIDEEGHKTYDCSCEDKRIMQLFVDAGNLPMIVLRFNPDSYVDAHGKKHASCFRYHKSLEVPQVKDEKIWTNRLEVLKEQVLNAVGHVPDRDIDVRHLFFDED